MLEVTSVEAVFAESERAFLEEGAAYHGLKIWETAGKNP